MSIKKRVSAEESIGPGRHVFVTANLDGFSILCA